MAVEHGNYARSVISLHVGFALTGVGTTLLGCILPALNIAWHLDDRSAGILFASQFAGSASGALLVGKDFFRSVLRGYALLIPSAVLLTFCSGFTEILLFLTFGLGLGLTMTATSMLIGSAALPNRGAALSVLNAVWGVGAAVSPLIAATWVSRWPPLNLFLVLAVALILTFFFIRKIRTVFTHQDDDTAQRASEPLQLRLLSLFAVIGFLYVGTETSISGWMMTYVGRLPISGKMWAPIATSCFWIVLLCGRTVVPMVGRWLSEAQLLTESLIAAFLCTALLLLSRVPLAIVVSASLAGLMLAPIFPLALAKVLRLAQGSPATKVVFAISGLGGAALPWITGELSAHTGSLRIGLLVPVFALGTMIILNRISSTSPALRHQN
jgi:FHS family glucose/mannose:H+ symporter-like MFS transporter